MNKTLPVILFICGLVVLVIIFLGGVYLGSQPSLQLSSSAKLQNLFESKAIQTVNIIAYGTVSNIGNGNITIASFPPNQESLKIPLSSNAKTYIYILSQSTKTASSSVAQKNSISLKDIKIGDVATVDIRINPGSQFEGTEVDIFPRQTSTTTAK